MPKSSSPALMVLTLKAEPPVDSTEQRMPCLGAILVHQPAHRAADRVIDAGDAAGADGDELLLRDGGRRASPAQQRDQAGRGRPAVCSFLLDSSWISRSPALARHAARAEIADRGIDRVAQPLDDGVDLRRHRR